MGIMIDVHLGSRKSTQHVVIKQKGQGKEEGGTRQEEARPDRSDRCGRVGHRCSATLHCWASQML